MVGVHDCVRIPVPHVDRAQTDHGNILGVVVDVDETSLYLVQTKQGVRTLGFVVTSLSCAEKYCIDSRLAARKHQ